MLCYDVLGVGNTTIVTYYGVGNTTIVTLRSWKHNNKSLLNVQHSPTLLAPPNPEQPHQTQHTQTGKQQAWGISQSMRSVGCIQDRFSSFHDIQPQHLDHSLPLQALAACKDENIRKMIDYNYWTKGLISKVKKKVLT